jgi:aminoglycoside phosphotransferase
MSLNLYRTGEDLILTTEEVQFLLGMLGERHQELRASAWTLQTNIAFGTSPVRSEQYRIAYFRALAELDSIELMARKIRQGLARSRLRA